MIFKCPKCSREIDAPLEYQGDSITCPSCKEYIRVPSRKYTPPPIKFRLPPFGVISILALVCGGFALFLFFLGMETTANASGSIEGVYQQIVQVLLRGFGAIEVALSFLIILVAAAVLKIYKD